MDIKKHLMDLDRNKEYIVHDSVTNFEILPNLDAVEKYIEKLYEMGIKEVRVYELRTYIAWNQWT